MIETKQEVAWNIIAEQTQFISGLIRAGINKYLKGDLNGWFEELTAIREMINHDLKLTEITTLDNLELVCWKSRSSFLKYSRLSKEGVPIPLKIRLDKKEFNNKVKEYSRTLMSILNRLGYFPKKDDRTKLSF